MMCLVKPLLTKCLCSSIAKCTSDVPIPVHIDYIVFQTLQLFLSVLSGLVLIVNTTSMITPCGTHSNYTWCGTLVALLVQ